MSRIWLFFISLFLATAIFMPQQSLAAACPGGTAFEPDGDWTSANFITVDDMVQSHAIDSKTDVDFVKFTAVACGRYTITTQALLNGLDTKIYLYDTNGSTLLISNDDYNFPTTLASQIIWIAPISGTYYVQIVSLSGGSCGDYEIKILEEFNPALSADAYESDNTSATAPLFSADSPAQAHTLHIAGDEDWVKFDATSGIPLLFKAQNSASFGNLILEIYDTDGSTLLDPPGIRDVFSDDVEWTTFTFPTTDVYYLRIRGCASISYELSIKTLEWLMPTSATPPSLIDTGINEGTEYADAFTDTFPWYYGGVYYDAQVWIKKSGNALADTIYFAFRIRDPTNSTTAPVDDFALFFEGSGTNGHDHSLVVNAAPIATMAALEDEGIGFNWAAANEPYFWDGSVWDIGSVLPNNYTVNVNYTGASEYDLEISLPVSDLFPSPLTSGTSDKGLVFRWGNATGPLYGQPNASATSHFPNIHSSSPTDDSYYYIHVTALDVLPPTSTPTPIPPSPTDTPTITLTDSPTDTFTWTPTSTWTTTDSPTYTYTPTHSPTTSGTFTYTPTWTATYSPTYTYSPTTTSTYSITYSPTRTWTSSQTPTHTPTYTGTFTHTSTATGTHTFTPTWTPTDTGTSTWTQTNSPTFTHTKTNSPTYTPTHTTTSTPSFTKTPTGTWTSSQTWTPTHTPSHSPTASVTASWTPTNSPTYSWTPSGTLTHTMTSTYSFTYTPTWTWTSSETWSRTFSATWTQTHTPTTIFSLTHTPTSTSSFTMALTPTPTMSQSMTGTVTYSPTLTPSTTPMDTRTYSPTLTLSLTPSASPTKTLTFTRSPTYTVTPTPHLPLFLNKNFFNPTGETLEIMTLATTSGPTSINVYNIVGERVRHIADVIALQGSPSTFTWDGTNDSGEYLGNGVYVIMLKSGAEVHIKKIIILK